MTRTSVRERRRGRADAAVVAASLLLVGSLATFVDATQVASGVGLGDVLRGRPAVTVAILVAVATLTLASWCRREGRAGVAAGLVIVAGAALLPVWAVSGWVPAWLVGPMYAAAALLVPGLVGVTLEQGSSRRPPNLYVLVWAASGCAVVLGALALDPWWEATCSPRCPDLDPPLTAALTHERAVVAAAALGIVAVGAGAVLVRKRAAAGSSASLTVSVLAALGIEVAAIAVALTRNASAASPAVRALGLSVALLVLGGVTWSAIRATRTRRILRGLVARLDADPAGVLDAHREASVAFAMPEGGWVDGRGLYLDAASVAMLTVVEDGLDGRVAISRRVSGDGRAFHRALEDVDRLVLDNAWMAAVTRAHQREVAASQRRIVELGDLELRRIAGDLHDGAQQRLVSAKVYLALARAAATTSEAHRLTAAESHLKLSLERLRALTHTVFPRLVESVGLVEALEDLRAHGESRVDLDTTELREPVPLTTALAVHAVVAATVAAEPPMNSRQPTRIQVGSTASGTLVVTIAATTSPSQTWPSDVSDRIEALGGTIAATDGVTKVVLPCE